MWSHSFRNCGHDQLSQFAVLISLTCKNIWEYSWGDLGYNSSRPWWPLPKLLTGFSPLLFLEWLLKNSFLLSLFKLSILAFVFSFCRSSFHHNYVSLHLIVFLFIPLWHRLVRIHINFNGCWYRHIVLLNANSLCFEQPCFGCWSMWALEGMENSWLSRKVNGLFWAQMFLLCCPD